jgi:hypothetical protein
LAQADSTGSVKPYWEIELNADYFVNSNAITTQFVNTVYKSGFIDEVLKNNVSGKLKYSNRIGADVNTGFALTRKPDSLFGRTDITWSIGLRNRIHADAVFSRDFFKVLMYGNKQYENNFADLGNTAVNFLSYQQLRASLEFEGDTSGGAFGFAFSFLKGQSNTMIDIDRAKMFTALGGTYIDLDIAATMRTTDTTKTGLSAFNGLGFSTDLYYEIPYVTWYGDGILRVDVRDLGLIFWNNKSRYYQIDSNYNYTGIEVQNLLGNDGGIIPTFNQDSILQANMKQRNEGYNTILPGIISITAQTYYGKKWIVEKGINYRYKANCKPYYYVGLTYMPTEKLLFAATTAYGGYGNFNAGAEIEITFPAQIKLHIDSYYINGYIFSEKQSAQGISIALSKRF